jgi:hypothetical protein
MGTLGLDMVDEAASNKRRAADRVRILSYHASAEEACELAENSDPTKYDWRIQVC